MRPSSQVSTPQFKEWFGDSKVVNSDGTPRKVFHGTSEDFSVFRCPAMFHVEPSYSSSVAGEGAGANLKACYLSIKNPADLRALNISPSDPYFADRVEDFKAKGYDGAQYREQAWIVFYPNQVKSATGNKGSFSQDSSDIREGIAKNVASKVLSIISEIYQSSNGVDNHHWNFPGIWCSPTGKITEIGVYDIHKDTISEKPDLFGIDTGKEINSGWDNYEEALKKGWLSARKWEKEVAQDNQWIIVCWNTRRSKGLIADLADSILEKWPNESEVNVQVCNYDRMAPDFYYTWKQLSAGYLEENF